MPQRKIRSIFVSKCFFDQYSLSTQTFAIFCNIRGNFDNIFHYQFFLGLLNTIIHTFMYAHYFVTSLKIWKPWWKKYLTQMQILQFILALFHFCQLWWVEDCGFPKSVGLLVIPQQSMMIWMFSKFYYQAYIKPSKLTKQINGSAKTKNGKPKKDS